MNALLLRRQWAHHPWRSLLAVLAVALGVALAWSVHLINSAALSEFSAAVSQTQGEPDLVVRGPREGFDDALFDTLLQHPGVAEASPVLELDTYALAAGSGTPQRVPVRVMGVDALRLAHFNPALLPQPTAGTPRLAALQPQRVFANAAAMQRLGLQTAPVLKLQAGSQWVEWQPSGLVAAGGAPLLVMDIAGAQAAFGLSGRLTRIDIRLAPGLGAAQAADTFRLPAGITAQAPGLDEARVSALSRAYRVNLTVLAGVALAVGAFMVYSVLALSVAQRTASLALLGVLGFSARQRWHLVLLEAAALGGLGALLGLALGCGLAWAALRWMAGDLGGGFFPGVQPTVQWQGLDALAFGVLGLLAALAGAWLPARQAERLPAARALKGLGAQGQRPASAWPGLLALGAGGLLALAPPMFGLPLAAYVSVALLLLGGVALVPVAVQALLQAWPTPHSALALLALRRAHHERHLATAVVSGVVASLALCVALTVMVASFREAVTHWLGQVLPADMYARSAANSALAEQSYLLPEALARVAAVPGVHQVQASRVRPLSLRADLPAVALVARELPNPQAQLPMVGATVPPQPGELGVYVSEAMRSLHGAVPGQTLKLPLAHAAGPALQVRVLGVWRDYARQFGTIAIDASAYRRVTGDGRINELALWLQPGADVQQVQADVREASGAPWLEFASTAQLREMSLRIFDRSFAVTHYLQMVAIGIGLAGAAASLWAQALARRREFGLLAHLGLTRGQVLRLVCAESAIWLAAATLWGLALGLGISAVLVHVVNPQSFHWTMPWLAPIGRLAMLCLAVWAAGLMASTWATQASVARMGAVRAVREEA